MESSPNSTGRHAWVSRRAVLSSGVALGAAIAVAPNVASAAGRSIRLVRGDELFQTIYHGPDSDPVVSHAASELLSYLEQITGRVGTIVSGPTPPPGPCFAIGRGNPVATSASINFDALGEDGFAYRVNGQRVVIAGASSRGTLYGVYWLLDRLLGVKWLSDDFTVVPTLDDPQIPVAALNTDHVPRFRYRQVMDDEAESAVHRQHNLLNGDHRQHDAATPAGVDTWSEYWPYESFGDGYHTMVPDQTLWTGNQLKAMEPRTRELAAANLTAAIQARVAAGHAPAHGFVQQDKLWTPDAASLAFANAHGGSLAAPTIDMCNDVLARIRTVVPGARISSQAYEYSFPVPSGIAPSDGVVMTVAAIRANMGQRLLGPDNAFSRDNITGWAAISDDVVMWHYLTTVRDYLMPYPNWYVALEDIKDLANLPAVQGYLGEGTYKTRGGTNSVMQVWTLARMLWDPTLDPVVVVREFLDGYYGAAADAVEDYYAVLRDAFEASGQQLDILTASNAGYLTWQAMREADLLMVSAAAAVVGDAARSKHVRLLRLSVDYVILLHCAEFAQAAAAAGVSWDLQLTDRVTRFDAALTESGLTAISNEPLTIAAVKSMVRIRRTAASPPGIVTSQSVPAEDWIDFQDPRFRLHRPTTSVFADPAASDGYSTRMAGGVPSWGVQVSLSSLPPTGQWKLYASIRLVLSTAADTDLGCTLGIYPSSLPAADFPVASFRDGAYHEIEFPGVHRQDLSGPYAYVSAPVVPGITDLLVDRVFAIRVD